MRPNIPVEPGSSCGSSTGDSQYSSYRLGPTGMTNTSITPTIADLDRCSAAGDQVHEEQDHRDDEQHVDDAAGHVKCEAKYPEQQQQDDKRPQHDDEPSCQTKEGKRCADGY